MERVKQTRNGKALTVRYSMFILGLAVMAFGCMLCIQAQTGVSPWDVFHIGLYQTFGLTIGTWSQIVGAVVIFISYLTAKIKPNIPMVLNMILFGWFLDFFMWLNLIPQAETLFTQYLMFAIGLFVMAVGIGMYISPRLGAGPRDSLMLALNEKLGWSIQRVRLVIEVVVLIAGWFMGGPVSFGTVLIALLTGPLIQRTIPFWENVMKKPYGRASDEGAEMKVAV